MIIGHYLILSLMLCMTGLVGMVINQRNLINMLMCLELIFLGINTNFVAFSQYFHDIEGQVMVFFVLAVAASESAIALAFMVLLYRKQQTIDARQLHDLHG